MSWHMAHQQPDTTATAVITVGSYTSQTTYGHTIIAVTGAAHTVGAGVGGKGLHTYTYTAGYLKVLCSFYGQCPCRSAVPGLTPARPLAIRHTQGMEFDSHLHPPINIYRSFFLFPCGQGTVITYISGPFLTAYQDCYLIPVSRLVHQSQAGWGC